MDQVEEAINVESFMSAIEFIAKIHNMDPMNVEVVVDRDFSELNVKLQLCFDENVEITNADICS